MPNLRWQSLTGRAGLCASLLLMLGTASCSDEDALGAARALCARPEALEFGPQIVRQPITRALAVTSCGGTAVQELRVEWIGEAAADAELQSATDPSGVFSIVETEVPARLDPSDHFRLPIRFRPTDTIEYQADLAFFYADRADDEPVTLITVSGHGVPAEACNPTMTPDAVNFGTVDTGSSADRTISLTNNGDASCDLAGARITSGHESFSLLSWPEESLEPGTSTSFDVRFAPRVGGELTGRAAVVVDGELQLSSSLSGNGNVVNRCLLVATPSPVIFARAAVDAEPTTGSFEIQNVGALDCTIEAVTITDNGTEFSVSHGPQSDTVLATGDTASVELTFAPQTVGARDGTASVTTREEMTLDVPLEAFGDPTPVCSLRFAPSPIIFEPGAVGLTYDVAVEVTNISALDCAITDARVVEGQEFAVVGELPLGTLAAGDSARLTVRYSPLVAALALDQLEIELNESETQAEDLVGFGDFADLRMTPSTTFFGLITEGCASEVQTVTLSNLGAVEARIDELVFGPTTDPNFELLTTIAPGTIIDPLQSIPIELRMLGVPNHGGHAGETRVFATGALQPMVRSRLFGQSESVEQAHRHDTFTQTERPVVDILFVVDSSGSMQQEQTSLAQNFNSFIQFFTSEVDVDFRIGVTTTDTETNGEQGALVGPYITNSGPLPTPDPVAEFTNQVNVGTDGSGTEKGLLASVLAVTPPNTEPGGMNEGFLRDEALLSIIYVSDEKDQSPGAVTDYIDQLLEVKGYQTQLLMASAIAGDVPGGCDANGNDADAGPRYLDISLSLGGIFESICTPDWSLTMQQLGFNTFAALTRFDLSRRPDASSVVVTVDGEPVPNDELNGWVYDEETNSIVFYGTSVPEAGAEVSVEYESECLEP